MPENSVCKKVLPIHKVLLLSLFVLIFLTVVCGWADSAGDVHHLVRQLGAESFQERQQADRQLRAMQRAVLPELRNALNDTDDPEILVRLQQIIEHIINNPYSIPQAFRVLTATERGAYSGQAAAFRETGRIVVSNTVGNTTTGGGFAQSFIPNSETITAIEVCTYPVSGSSGWMRLDLCMDDSGIPGEIIARSWVLIPENHGFPYGEYVYHDFPDQHVDPSATYWMVYSEFPAPGSGERLLAHYGLSGSGNQYPNGMLWIRSSAEPRPEADVKFRVFSSESGIHPAYRPATEKEQQTVSIVYQTRIWNDRINR